MNAFRRRLALARAARAVQNGPDPFGHLRLCTALEQVDLGLPPNAFASLDFALRSHARTCVRQRLVAFVVYQRLLKTLMTHLATPGVPVPVPAPARWRAYLRTQGVTVTRDSVLRWWVLCVLFYGHGLRTAAGLVAALLRHGLEPPPRHAYAVLMHLQPACVPLRRDAPSFDLVSWYRGSPIFDREVREIWAHVPRAAGGSRPQPDVFVTPQYLPRLEGAARVGAFLGRLVWLVAATTLAGLAGRWWDMVMLEQRVLHAYTLSVPSDRFARAYVFNNSMFVLRPLWTYVAEASGSTIDLLFYATNIETFGVSPAQPRPFWPGYIGMSWQRYAVWNDNQAQLMRDFGHAAARILIVGPVAFTDTASTPPALPAGCVVIFDVTPQRPMSLAKRGIPQPYYTSRTWIHFMDDVVASTLGAGLTPVYKKKREIGKVSAGAFRTWTERAAAEGRIFVVDPDVAAHWLIDRALAVVSMPFTSTALIARARGKPSVFYDPLGTLVGETRLAHGVPVIGSARELDGWMAGLGRGNVDVKESRVTAWSG